MKHKDTCWAWDQAGFYGWRVYLKFKLLPAIRERPEDRQIERAWNSFQSGFVSRVAQNCWSLLVQRGPDSITSPASPRKRHVNCKNQRFIETNIGAPSPFAARLAQTQHDPQALIQAEAGKAERRCLIPWPLAVAVPHEVSLSPAAISQVLS